MQMIMLIVTMLLLYVNNNEYIKNYLIILRENFDFNQQTKLNHMFFSFVDNDERYSSINNDEQLSIVFLTFC